LYFCLVRRQPDSFGDTKVPKNQDRFKNVAKILQKHLKNKNSSGSRRIQTPARYFFPTCPKDVRRAGQAFIFLNGIFIEFLNAIFKMVIFQFNYILAHF